MRRIILLMGLFLICAATSLFGISYAASNKEDYELQERCGKPAAERFKEVVGSEGYHSDKNGSYFRGYTNHYNRKLNKCFILITATSISTPTNPSNFTDKILWDINENKQYGGFTKFLGVPRQCEVLGKPCHSEQEWDSLVKPYMEE